MVNEHVWWPAWDPHGTQHDLLAVIWRSVLSTFAIFVPRRPTTPHTIIIHVYILEFSVPSQFHIEIKFYKLTASKNDQKVQIFT